MEGAWIGRRMEGWQVSIGADSLESRVGRKGREHQGSRGAET